MYILSVADWFVIASGIVGLLGLGASAWGVGLAIQIARKSNDIEEAITITEKEAYYRIIKMQINVNFNEISKRIAKNELDILVDCSYIIEELGSLIKFGEYLTETDLGVINETTEIAKRLISLKDDELEKEKLLLVAKIAEVRAFCKLS